MHYGHDTVGDLAPAFHTICRVDKLQKPKHGSEGFRSASEDLFTRSIERSSPPAVLNVELRARPNRIETKAKAVLLRGFRQWPACPQVAAHP